MNAKEAVAARILALCEERGIAINALAGSAGVSPSTVYSMLNAKSQNPGVVSLQKLCDGLGISTYPPPMPMETGSVGDMPSVRTCACS